MSNFATTKVGVSSMKGRKNEKKQSVHLEYVMSELPLPKGCDIQIKGITIDVSIAGKDYTCSICNKQSRLVPVKVKGEDLFEIELRNIVAIVPLRDNEFSNARRGGNKQILFLNRKPGILVDFKLKTDIAGKLKLEDGELIEICNGYYVNRNLLNSLDDRQRCVSVSYMNDHKVLSEISIPISRRKLRVVRNIVFSEG